MELANMTSEPPRSKTDGAVQDVILGLHSSKSTQRLEQIASLRKRGISDHVNLPQLVVCGDQSAGKSSVLEGVTGLPFPRQDGICTKFPTEIILQHSTEEQVIIATIIPSATRTNASKTALRKYVHRLKSFEELPHTIDEVGTLMGVRGFQGIAEGPAFGQDVLRIEVSGATGLHMTVVDLPGLISVASEEQTEEDVETVQNLVDSYLSNPRTIILAVVQASNDIANQGIIQKSRRFDKQGQRTVGIITKPDLINAGTEKRIALLAKNQDTTKLKLGFFLVKNPSPTQLAQNMTVEQRQKNENLYFKAAPWKEQALNPDRVGIASLRTYLQNLLDHHIERELPKVRTEIGKMMQDIEEEMARLGEDRTTLGQMRMFLSQLAMQFHNLTVSALNGTYHETDNAFFLDVDNETQCTRLRALVHQLNTAYAEHMREYGQTRKIQPDQPMEDCSESKDDQENGCLLVTEAEMKNWVRNVYAASRGKELPGNYNHVFLSRLFHVQSSRWSALAENHIHSIHQAITTFVRAAIRHVIKDEQVYNEVLETVMSSLQKNLQKSKQELCRLCDDEKLQPITYNHYYTDNVQNARQDAIRKMLKRAMNETTAQDWNGKLHVSNNTLDSAKLLFTLQSRIIVNMEEQACAEALSGLHAYYKVAMKTFVDNVCRQIIERHLLRDLSAVFSPNKIAALTDEELQRMAAETPESVDRKRHLRELNHNLEESLQDLRR